MATFKIILKNKSHSNGLFPIYLRVTKDRKSKLISTGYYCEKSQWNENKDEFRKGYPNYVQKNATLDKLQSRAEKIFNDAVTDGNDLTLNEFEELFFSFKADKKVTVNDFWQDKIDSLVKAKQTGNARAYTDTKRSFFKFFGESKIMFFKEITPQLLNKYEVFLRSNNGTDGGISVKMRTIRALYNDAIEEELASKENYPFTTYKISKFKNSGSKRAISSEEIEKIKTLDCVKNPSMQDSRNYFIFSYYTRGMNFYDMMLLRWSDIEGDKIIYTRRKTKGNFSIKVTPPVKEILDYYRGISKNKTRYVFPDSCFRRKSIWFI